MTMIETTTETITTAQPATETITLDRGDIRKFIGAARKYCGTLHDLPCTIYRDADGLHYLAKRTYQDIRFTVTSGAGDAFFATFYGDDLNTMAGKRGETVEFTLTGTRSGCRAKLEWNVGSAACQLEAYASYGRYDWHVPPMVDVPGLPAAIDRAEQCCNPDAKRWAIQGYLIDGTNIVATDSRQLLVQHNVIPADMPHSREIVVPAFGLRAIIGKRAKSLSIGFGAGRIVYQSGPWTIRTDGLEGRFPKYADVIRDATDDSVRLAMTATDFRRYGRWTDNEPGTHTEISLQRVLQHRTIDTDCDSEDYPEPTENWCRFADGTVCSGYASDNGLNITLDTLYWQRGLSFAPDWIGFDGGGKQVVFRSDAATYLAMPIAEV